MGCERVEQAAPVEVGLHHRGCAESVPVAPTPAVVHDDDRATRAPTAVNEVAIGSREPAVEEQGGEGPARAETRGELVDRHAFDEIGGNHRRHGPPCHVAEPRATGTGQSEDDETIAGHQGCAGSGRGR